MAEFCIGSVSDIDFHFFPGVFIISDFFAGSTNGQQPLQVFHFFKYLKGDIDHGHANHEYAGAFEHAFPPVDGGFRGPKKQMGYVKDFIEPYNCYYDCKCCYFIN